MIEQPIFESLKNIKQETLVIFGKNDSLIPNKYLHKTTTEEIAQLGTKQIPNAKLILLDNCGHFAQIESREKINGLIKSFISSDEC